MDLSLCSSTDDNVTTLYYLNVTWLEGKNKCAMYKEYDKHWTALLPPGIQIIFYTLKFVINSPSLNIQFRKSKTPSLEGKALKNYQTGNGHKN